MKHPYITAATIGIWAGLICACILAVLHAGLMGFYYDVMIKQREPYTDWRALIDLGVKVILLRDLDLYAFDFMLKGMCFYIWFVFMLSRYSISPRKIHFLAPLIGVFSSWLFTVFVFGPLLHFLHHSLSVVILEVAILSGAFLSPFLVIVRERPRSKCSACDPQSGK